MVSNNNVGIVLTINLGGFIMGTRKNSEQNVRNITQNSSGTYSISLPKKFVKSLNWRQKQRVTVTKDGKKLIIEDWEE